MGSRGLPSDQRGSSPQRAPPSRGGGAPKPTTPFSTGALGSTTASLHSALRDDTPPPPVLDINFKDKRAAAAHDALGYKAGDLILTPRGRHGVVMGSVERREGLDTSRRLWVQYLDEKDQGGTRAAMQKEGSSHSIPQNTSKSTGSLMFEDGLPTSRTRTEAGEPVVMAAREGPAKDGFMLPARPRVEKPDDAFTSLPYCRRWGEEPGMPDELEFGEHSTFATGKLVRTPLGSTARVRGTAHFRKEFGDSEGSFSLDGKSARIGTKPGCLWLEQEPDPSVPGSSHSRRRKPRKVVIPIMDEEMGHLALGDGSSPALREVSAATAIMDEIENLKRQARRDAKERAKLMSRGSPASSRAGTAASGTRGGVGVGAGHHPHPHHPHPHHDGSPGGGAPRREVDYLDSEAYAARVIAPRALPPRLPGSGALHQSGPMVALQSGFGAYWSPQMELFRRRSLNVFPVDARFTRAELASRGRPLDAAAERRRALGERHGFPPMLNGGGGRYSTLPSRSPWTSHGGRTGGGDDWGGGGGSMSERGGRSPNGRAGDVEGVGGSMTERLKPATETRGGYRRFGVPAKAPEGYKVAKVQTNPPLAVDGWWP